ncbi:hypothetical protein [Flavobacterium alkalisoli]|uniref:hypothetical protein n=1 Tax=Flavobacterium alkalisoli TaxID=2602769 RepID=UPI003A8FDD88
MTKPTNKRVQSWEVVWGVLSPAISLLFTSLTGPWKWVAEKIGLPFIHNVIRPAYMVLTRKVIMAQKEEEIKNKNNDITEAQNNEDDFIDAVNRF